MILVCIGTVNRNEPGRRPALRFMGSSLFLLDLLTGHEPALAPERELSQLAALRQATRLSRFSARANICAAVWDKPRSSLRRPEERRFMESSLFLPDLLTGHEPALAPERELSHLPSRGSARSAPPSHASE